MSAFFEFFIDPAFPYLIVVIVALTLCIAATIYVGPFREPKQDDTVEAEIMEEESQPPFKASKRLVPWKTRNLARSLIATPPPEIKLPDDE